MFLLIKFNKKKLLIITIIMILSLGLNGCSSKNKEGLVAEVNGEAITEEEFNADYQVFKTLYEKQLGKDALDQVGQDGKTLEQSLKESILEKLIMERIVAKESDTMNISVSDEEVSEQLASYIDEMGGQEKFDEFLDNNDITMEFFQDNMKKELLVNKHKVEFLKGIDISEDEAKKFFEENKDNLVILKASHILVATEEEGNAILERLKNGEDFAKIATLESLDTVSAARGGDLGYFGKGAMIAEFEDAAMALKEGEISKLVKTEVGYHIIKLHERKDTFEELRDEIINLLKEQKYVEAFQKLRDDAKVEKYLK
jgi:foldase protein PrsA